MREFGAQRRGARRFIDRQIEEIEVADDRIGAAVLEDQLHFHALELRYADLARTPVAADRQKVGTRRADIGIDAGEDRKSVVKGKSGVGGEDIGGGRIKKKKEAERKKQCV